MTRVVVFLVLVGILALVVGWFADQPGAVEIVWLNYRITTSVGVLVAAIVLLTALLLVVWSVLRALLRSPGQFSQRWRSRRMARGQRAITRGFIAVGAGDLRGARKFADEAKRLARDEPLTLLLGAQAAQLVGDRAAAEEAFRAM